MGGGWGWVESRIRLISAEAEAEALLGLAELGNIVSHSICMPTKCLPILDYILPHPTKLYNTIAETFWKTGMWKSSALYLPILHYILPHPTKVYNTIADILWKTGIFII